MRSIDIITGIRKQTALVRGLLYHLWQLEKISWTQKEAVRAAEIEFNKLPAYYYVRLRKTFGDEYPERADKCDMIAAGDFPDRPSEILNLIKEETANLQRMYLELPGDENTISPEKEKAMDEIQEYLRIWRAIEFGKLKNAFE